MTSAAVAEDQGLMSVTPAAIEARKAHKIVGEVIAHYQLVNSRDTGRDVYWIESYDAKGKFTSGYLIELLSEGGQTWAACQCKWFQEYRKSSTVCKHIYAAVLMHKKRG